MTANPTKKLNGAIMIPTADGWIIEDRPEPCPYCAGDGGHESAPWGICRQTGAELTDWRKCKVCETQASLAQTIQDVVEAWFYHQDISSEPGLTPAEKREQAARCGCRGADDYCGCQNVPDAETRRVRDEFQLTGGLCL